MLYNVIVLFHIILHRIFNVLNSTVTILYMVFIQYFLSGSVGSRKLSSGKPGWDKTTLFPDRPGRTEALRFLFDRTISE